VYKINTIFNKGVSVDTQLLTF